MQKLPSGVHAGAVVDVRGQAWQVTRVEPFAQCSLLTLDGRGALNLGLRVQVIAPFDRPIASSASQRLRCRRRQSLLRSVAGALADEQPATGLWAAGRADLDVLPWQLAPVLSVLNGATRLLLADAVGLGKTVQAGLILAELRARALLSRALVLTPAGLRATWATELRQRFGIPALVLDHAALLTLAADLPADANPWRAASIVVSSIDLVKRPEVRAAVEACPLDLLVVDEAHHLAPGSARADLVSRLAVRTPWVILMSATPHAGDDAAFALLTDVGRCSPSEPAMTIFRRTRASVGLSTSRKSHTLVVVPTAAEGALLAGVHAYARTLWHHGSNAGGPARLLATVLARRAASSAAAIELTLRRRLALLSGSPRPSAEVQPALPWVETDEADADASLVVLSVRGFDDLEAETAMLQRLIELANAARPTSSKMQRLTRLLGRVNEPMVVFTEFRDTLEAVARHLQPIARIVCIHGGMDEATRSQALRDFTHGTADVLLATDAAGEGLNLHHRSRLVVTIEWPWSPRRLEQRIGRVDRIGQKRTVHAIHLTQRGTVEEAVLAHMTQRRRSASEALDEAEMSEPSDEAIASTILGDVDLPASVRRRWTPPVVGGTADEASRLLQCRHLRRIANVRPLTGAAWAGPRRHVPAPRRVVALFEVADTTTSGVLQSRTTVPLALSLTVVPATRRDWRLVMDRIATDAPHLAAVRAQASPNPVNHEPIRQRIHRIRQHRPRAQAELVQSSLFDRRALRALETRSANALLLDTHLTRLLALVDAASTSERRVRLLAAWPEA